MGIGADRHPQIVDLGTVTDRRYSVIPRLTGSGTFGQMPMIGIVQWFLKAKDTQGFREGAENYARGRAWSQKAG